MRDLAALLTTVRVDPPIEVRVDPAMRDPVVPRAEVRAVLDTTVREAWHIEDPVELLTTAQVGPPTEAPVDLAMLARVDPAIQVRVGWLNAAQRSVDASRFLVTRCAHLGAMTMSRSTESSTSRAAWSGPSCARRLFEVPALRG